MSGYGSQAMWGDLERVLVRPPLAADANHVGRYGWRGVPDAAAAAAEHEELRALLEAAGAEVIVSEHDPGNPDAIYVYDPVLVGDGGAALLRPGKEGRLGEPEGIGASLEAAGIPVASQMAAPATVEGGDTRLARPRHAARRPRLSHGHGRASPRCARPSRTSR